MKLNDKRTPTCPNCGMHKLETEDIIDTWTEGDETDPKLIELTVGICPNCEHTFEYKQIYTHQPFGYEILTDCTEDEEEEEENDT